MSWEIHPASTAFARFRQDWDRLNRQLFASHPFFDSRFIGLLLEHFADGTEWLCLHRDGSDIDGALILRPLGLGRWSLFLPAQAQIGAVLLRNAKILTSLFPALPGHAWSIDLLALDPRYCPDWHGLRLPHLVREHALTMSIAGHSDFAEYWQQRPRNLIKNLRRYIGRAEEAGKIRVAVHTDGIAIAAAFARYADLETRGWKGKAGTAISRSNVQGRFYGRLLQQFAQEDKAAVWELLLDDIVIASRLVLLGEAHLIIIKTTYDESFRTLAPGRLLLHRLLEWFFATKPAPAIEFYTNATRDQAEWASMLRPIEHHQILRNEGSALFYFATRKAREWLTNEAPSSDERHERPKPRHVSVFKHIEELPPAAYAMAEAAGQQSFETSPGWFHILQKTVYAADPSVRYFLLEFQGKPRLLLPLRCEKKGPAHTIWALSNFYTSLYAPIAQADATISDMVFLLKAVLAEYGAATAIRLAPMDPATATYDMLIAALYSIGWMPFRYFCFGNWRQTITETWKDYFAARPGILRSTAARKKKKFIAAGGRFEIVTGGERLASASIAYQTVYARSWKKAEPYPSFIPELIQWLAAQGWLRLGIAWLGDQPIAAQIWVVSHGKASIFKLAYDKAFAKHAVGTLLTAHLMEHVIDGDRVSVIDYLIGDAEHKKNWMNERRERWGIVAHDPFTWTGCVSTFRQSISDIMRRING